MSKRVLILAPHVDDELIGCSQILFDRTNQVTVGWFYDITQERRNEGQNAAAMLGFTPIFNFSERDADWSNWDLVLVPRRDDAHPAHKNINTRFREHATGFYSVDMVSAPVLTESAQTRKRETLNWLYPSQSALWERDHKYWLFEKVSPLDYETYTTLDLGLYTITCLAEYQAAVNKVAVENHVGLSFLRDVSVNRVIAACPSGKVVIESKELRFKVVI